MLKISTVSVKSWQVRHGWTTCLLYQVLKKSIKNQVQFSRLRLGQALLNCLHFQDFIFVEVKKTSFGTCSGTGYYLTKYMQLRGMRVMLCIREYSIVKCLKTWLTEGSHLHWEARDLNCTWVRTCSIQRRGRYWKVI